MPHQRVEKWKRWIDGPMQREIVSMHLYRKTWDQVRTIIRDNGTLPNSYWWQYMLTRTS